MKGLLWKDWLMLWKQYRIFVALALFYIVLGTVKAENLFWMGIAGLFMSMLPVTALALDERSHWDQYAIMLPCSKRDMVRAKYLVGISGVLGVCVLYLIFRTGFCLVTEGAAPVGEIFTTTLNIICGSLIYLSVNLPVMFKRGVEKGRLWFYMTVALMVGVFTFIVKWREDHAMAGRNAEAVLQNQGLSGNAEFLMTTPTIMLVIITVVMLTVSVKIAEHFYEKREI